MRNKPLISVTIPTLNSGKYIDKCLNSIINQTYKNTEVIIVDGRSTDDTLTIVRREGVKKVFTYENALLGAREMGVKKSKGEYILLLDSDQILEKDCLERAVEMMKKFDMLVLEEGVYVAKNWLEKLFKQDRILIHTAKDFSPYTGVMLPRFFRKSLLTQVFTRIPEKVKMKVGGQDHAIIYFEAWDISQKVGFLRNAVRHIEPNSIIIMWKKFYRWGYTSADAHYGKYDKLLKKKERFRNGLFKRGYLKESIGSIILLFIKGVPYKIGYLSAKLFR